LGCGVGGAVLQAMIGEGREDGKGWSHAKRQLGWAAPAQGKNWMKMSRGR